MTQVNGPSGHDGLQGREVRSRDDSYSLVPNIDGASKEDGFYAESTESSTPYRGRTTVNISSVARMVVITLVSGVAGYALRQPDPVPVVAPHNVQASPAGSTSNSPPAPPLIAVASDGNVTLRVDQQPLEWVLEQIAAQGGNVKVTATAAAVRQPSLAAPSCPEVTAAARVDSAKLLREIQQGSEEQRVEGLLDARSAGVYVPDATLKTLFETDASERVRLHAFEAYLERQTGDNAAQRRTLEAALLIPSPVIQREAKARLDELNDMERVDALFKQQAGR